MNFCPCCYDRKIMPLQLMCPSCWERVPDDLRMTVRQTKKDRASEAFKTAIESAIDRSRTLRLLKEEEANYVAMWKGLA